MNLDLFGYPNELRYTHYEGDRIVNIGVYRQALEQYVADALANSDGTHAGISNYLWNLKVSGLFVPNKAEKQKALDDARQAFDEHRNWPVNIILSHLGIKPGH